MSEDQLLQLIIEWFNADGELGQAIGDDDIICAGSNDGASFNARELARWLIDKGVK